MLFVTVQAAQPTYASSQHSSRCVAKVRAEGPVGDQAIRTARIGLPAVDSSPSDPHDEASHSRVFGLLTVFVPVFDRYAIAASAYGTASRYWTNTPSSDKMSVGNVPAIRLPVMTVPNSTTNQPMSAVWLGLPVVARFSRRFVVDVRFRVADATPGLSSFENGVFPPLYGSVLPVNAIARDNVTAGDRAPPILYARALGFSRRPAARPNCPFGRRKAGGWLPL